MNEFKVNNLIQRGDLADIWEGVHIPSKTPIIIVIVEKGGHIIDHERMSNLTNLMIESKLSHV